MSNNARRAYEHGEKPAQADYANGLDKFFSVGDRRLTPNGNGGYTLETWSGSEWVAEDDEILYSIRFNIIDVNGKKYDRVVELDYKVFNRKEKMQGIYQIHP